MGKTGGMPRQSKAHLANTQGWRDSETLRSNFARAMLLSHVSFLAELLDKTHALCKPPPELNHIACLNDASSGNASAHAHRAQNTLSMY